ncbi:transposable element tc3 transposase protein [Rutstroemia sp. NJR-2017a BBW]|nr:transposable element tc3 transposase protein [Rutstroemia sp. NJR-2017a BBW]
MLPLGRKGGIGGRYTGRTKLLLRQANGKRGGIWVTRRPDEKRCLNCIQSVHCSGRVSVMIWGMIGWDYKSPLVFLEKRPGCRGVDSTAYKEQVLEPIIFPLFEKAGLKYIFMEDGAKVHKWHARLARSPDLNPIEKVWRWVKHKINQLPFARGVDSQYLLLFKS